MKSLRERVAVNGERPTKYSRNVFYPLKAIAFEKVLGVLISIDFEVFCREPEDLPLYFT